VTDRFIDWFIEKILRVRPLTGEPVKADPPPWDVPLDQTTGLWRVEGDKTRL
jgi:hypothetical protein